MATDPNQVPARIATRVRAQRTRRRWTLDELARRSSVSRRLLVQIEQADANPSLSTLLKLAATLDIPLADLLAEPAPSPPVAVVPQAEAMTLWSTPAGSAARLLVSLGPLELWSWTLAPGDRRASEAHRPGSIELLTVETGTLSLEVGDDRVDVRAGDSARFEATRPHAYANASARTTTFRLVVLEPVDGDPQAA